MKIANKRKNLLFRHRFGRHILARQNFWPIYLKQLLELFLLIQNLIMVTSIYFVSIITIAYSFLKMKKLEQACNSVVNLLGPMMKRSLSCGAKFPLDSQLYLAKLLPEIELELDFESNACLVKAFDKEEGEQELHRVESLSTPFEAARNAAVFVIDKYLQRKQNTTKA